MAEGVDSQETRDADSTAEARLQNVFDYYKQDFTAALNKSTDILRTALAVAQQSISSQLQQLEEQSLATSPSAREPQPKPAAADAIEEVFTRVAETLSQLHTASVEAIGAAQRPSAQAAAPDTQPTNSSQCPIESARTLMSHATQSLDEAIQALLEAMNRKPAGRNTSV